MSSSRYNNTYENPSFHDGYQTQSQLIREQDDELEIVSGNGKFLLGKMLIFEKKYSHLKMRNKI